MQAKTNGSGSGAKRAAARFALLSLVMLALACALASAASAAYYTHPFVSMFGPDGTAGTKFGSEVRAVAVDQATHDVYVLERKLGVGNSILYRFTSTGQPDPFTAGPNAGTNTITGLTASGEVAVAPPGALGGTAGDVYLASNGKIEIYASTGAHLGTLDGSGNPSPHPGTDVGGLATDAAGNLYATYIDAGGNDGHLDKYVPSANPVENSDFDSEITYPQNFPCSPAVRPSGTSVLSCITGHGQAVDFSTGDLYVGEFTELTGGGGEFLEFTGGVRQLDEADKRIAFIKTPITPSDVDVDASSGDVFVVMASGTVNDPQNRKVSIYGDGVLVAPPVATIDPPTSVTYKAAHFTGTINSGGTGAAEATTYRFACTPACPGLEGPRSVPTDGADHAVSDDAEGLAPETKYTVKLIATNGEGGQSVEAEAEFETPAKPDIAAPAATIELPSGVGAEFAHLSGTVDPMGTGEGQGTTYRFEYSTDGLKWTASKTQGPIEGLGPQPVSDDLEGLVPNMTYSVRLKATNDGGEDVSDPPDPSFTTDAVAPRVEVTAATQISEHEARINARVDPRNAQTTYYFQWGSADCASNPCASIPASQQGDAGSGAEFVWESARLEALDPVTTYHYRLIAESPGGKAITPSASFTTEATPGACPNQALRVGASAALPDCRAYELVSPHDKGGGNIGTYSRRTRVAADGNAVSYVAYAAFAGAAGSPVPGNEYVAARGPEGWSTAPISPYQAAPYQPNAYTGAFYTGAFSPDLDSAVFRAFAPIPGVTTPNVEAAENLYLATGLRSGRPSFQLLTDSVNPLLGDYQDTDQMTNVALGDTSANFGKVVFETTENLTADAGGIGHRAYESEGGEVRLAGILPDVACASPPCPAAESVLGEGATAGLHARQDSGTFTQLAHVVSDDGSKVFFTAGDPLKEFSIGPAAYWGSLYARIDGAHTVQIDASERTTPDPAGPGRSRFGMATPDGQVVYFVSKEQLLDADTDSSDSLYRYDFAKPAGQRLSLIRTPDLIPLFVAGISDSGDIVYVVGVVKAAGVEGNGLVAVHNGDASLVATGLRVQDHNLGEYTFAGDGGETPLRVTPDGRFAMFVSEGNLVGYDPLAEGCGSIYFGEVHPCNQIYLYSYDSGELTCVSCDFGHTSLGAGITFPQSDVGIPLEPTLLNTPTPLSSDGRYVFFSTAAALDPRDTNGRVDAYAYDTEKQEALLISSGQCNCDSAFQNSSPDGRDVFFTTREQLVRSDTDDLSDLYDARIGGGIAAQNALAPVECQGDACQPLPNPPSPITPASNGFEGPGSASGRKPPTRGRCAKGKRRAHKAGKGRCVKAPKRHKTHKAGRTR